MLGTIPVLFINVSLYVCLCHSLTAFFALWMALLLFTTARSISVVNLLNSCNNSERHPLHLYTGSIVLIPRKSPGTRLPTSNPQKYFTLQVCYNCTNDILITNRCAVISLSNLWSLMSSHHQRILPTSNLHKIFYTQVCYITIALMLMTYWSQTAVL